MPEASHWSRPSKLSTSDCRVQPGAAVAEVLEPQRLERHVVGLTVEREGLHDAVVADLVEAAVEAELHAVASRDVAPATARRGVPVEDLGVHPVRPDPAGEQLGIGVGPHQLRRRGVEVAGHADDRQGGIGLDRDLVAVARGGHDAAPCSSWWSVGRSSPRISARTDVEALVALLGLLAVPLDPLRHQVEDLRLEVARSPLGVLALTDQARVGEHLDVLGHRLDGDVVGIGQLAHGGVAHGEAGHHVAPRRIGECANTRDSWSSATTTSLFN